MNGPNQMNNSDYGFQDHQYNNSKHLNLNAQSFRPKSNKSGKMNNINNYSPSNNFNRQQYNNYNNEVNTKSENIMMDPYFYQNFGDMKLSKNERFTSENIGGF
jgi:hypothetical protein